MATFDYVMKVFLVGDTRSGKTSIIKRYLDDEFEEDFTPSEGAIFYKKDIECHGRVVQL